MCHPSGNFNESYDLRPSLILVCWYHRFTAYGPVFGYSGVAPLPTIDRSKPGFPNGAYPAERGISPLSLENANADAIGQNF